MRFIFIFILLLFTTFVAVCQFSGKIIYKESYKSKTQSISISDFEKFAGTKRELSIQGSFYKNVHNGKEKSIMIYRGDENRLYRFNERADTILWMDASRDTLSRISESEIENSNEIILGLKCKMIEVKTRFSSTTYYFSDTYEINPQDFKNHHLEYWDFYTSIAKAIPLKIVFESEEMSLTSIAVKVQAKKLNDRIFDVPSGYLKKLF